MPRNPIQVLNKNTITSEVWRAHPQQNSILAFPIQPFISPMLGFLAWGVSENLRGEWFFFSFYPCLLIIYEYFPKLSLTLQADLQGVNGSFKYLQIF